MKKISKSNVLFAAVLLFFSVICCLTNIISGDDYIGYYSYIDPAFSYMSNLSGRYFANMVANPLLRNIVTRFLVYVPLLFLCIWLFSECVQIKEKRIGISWLALGLFCTMIPEMFAQVVMWLGGFASYVPPVVLILLYIRTAFREFAGKPVKSRLTVPAFALIGFAGSLFTEHMTLYACCFTAFVLIYSFFRNDLHIRAYQIAHAAAAAAGAVMMFLNPNYSAIANGTEEHTYRFIEFSPIDIIMQLYMKVIPLYSQRLWLINFLIAAALLFLFKKADKKAWKPDKQRFAKAALAVVIAFPIYFCFNYGYVRINSIDGAMRVSALETAFAFLHLISVLYLGVILSERKSSLRLTVFLMSTVICSAPFCMANPVSPRCFFSTFCFWLLAALEICSQAVCVMDRESAVQCRTAAYVFSMIAAGYLSYINILNAVAFHINVTNLKQQLSDGNQDIIMIEEPYEIYTPSRNFNGFFENYKKNIEGAKQDYITCILRYYDIPEEQLDPEKLKVTVFSLYDYFV